MKNKPELRDLERLSIATVIMTPVMIGVYFSGGYAFVKDHPYDAVILAITLLTFVSIFFSFIYLNFFREWDNKFKTYLNDVANELKGDIHKDQPTKVLRNLSDGLDKVQGMKKDFSPEYWLYSSIFLLFFSIPLGLLSSNNSSAENIMRHAQAAFLHIGIITTFSLLIAVMGIRYITIKQGKQ